MANRWKALGIAWLFALCLYGQTINDRQSFADSLMAQKDYYRAISEYKALDFYTQDCMQRQYARRQIIRAYYESGKYRDMLGALDRYERIDTSGTFTVRCNCLRGLAYYRLGEFLRASSCWMPGIEQDSTGYTKLYASLLMLEAGNDGEADSLLQDVAGQHAGQEVGKTAIAAIAATHALKTGPRVSPGLALGLSAVVPGLGQYYTGHTYDGMLACLYVGVFTYAGCMAYQYDHDRGHGYFNTTTMFSLDALFYTANLIGSYKTAKFRNARTRELALDKIRSVFWTLTARDLI